MAVSVLIMSFASPADKAIPLQEDPTLPHIPTDNASFQLQGFLYQAEMCRKDCGFYGNPAWHGYCSRCWIQQRQQAQPLTDGFRHHSGNLHVKPDMSSTPQQLNRNDTFPDVTGNNVKMERSTSSLYQPVTGSVLHFSRSCLLSLARGDFSEFLKVLRSPEAQPLSSLCSNFIQRMQDADHITVDRKAEEVQSFYGQIGLSYPDHMSDEKDRLLDNIEKLVMTRLYKSVFCLENSQDEQKDLSLKKRIKSLSWVTPRMLQLPLKEDGQEENNGISCAVTALIEMDAKRAPQDKLTYVSRACNYLYKSIQSSKKEPATADDLLSCLIYSTLKANPPRLWSNLQYITRFCNPRRLITGESGYYFTNLCCAASFIETLEASSLGLTQEEFNRLMQGSEATTFISNSGLITLQQIEKNNKHLAELQHRQDLLFQKAKCLGKEVEAWLLSVQGEIEEIIHRFPLDTKASAARSV
ncbi:rab5 GDP/GTP exchange factor-like isoform 2-T2 [Anomaloglossus baeobatrachus]|uniref:rab5 GDP/GTP exchange factor-like isoform X2 n=1 Tax=Anomaloglossus baeobatrachus TaxID=238106 RepID=UPI003F50102B